MEYAQTFPEARGRWPLPMRVRGVLRHAALSVLGQFSNSPAVPTLRLLYCHHVFDDERAEFARVIDYLMGMGDFINTADVVRVIDGDLALRRNSFHLSFDDGYRNIFTNALPTLRERSIPALMFIATTVTSKPAAFPHLQRLFPPGAKKVEHASWSEIELAFSLGLEIGSHTRSHPYLSLVSASAEVLHEEIVNSKSDLEQKFGRCDYFSWPYGELKDVDDRSLSVVEQAGYRACFGAFRGRIIPNVTNRFKIPRHHFEPHWPISHIRYFANGGGENRTAHSKFYHRDMQRLDA